MIYQYFAHGLRLTSEIELQDFDVAISHSDAKPDLVIKLGTVPLADDRKRDSWINISSDGRFATLEVDGCANFMVVDGCSITVEPFADRPQFGSARLRAYLLGRVFGVALYQRGMTPLHGSAVRVGGGAVVFVGDRGAGKSTLCYHFMQCGYGLLADDVTCYSVTDDAIAVMPGIRRNKLWQDTLSWYGVECDQLEPVEEQTGKFHVYHHLPEIGTDAIPLRAIIALEPFGAGCDPHLVPTTAVEALQLLYAQNYEAWLINYLGLSQRFLDCGTRIVSRVPVMRMVRPRSLDALDATVSLISSSDMF